MLPVLFVATIFGWMLLIGRGRSSSRISLAAFGMKVDFNASRAAIKQKHEACEYCSSNKDAL